MDVIVTAAIIAFIAGIAGAATTSIVAYKIAVKQIHANTVTGERLRWLEDFRTTAAHIISLVIKIRFMTIDASKPMTTAQLDEIATLTFHLTRFASLLNPSKASHQALEDSASALLKSLGNLDTDGMKKAGGELKSEVRKILKDEWDDIQTTMRNS